MFRLTGSLCLVLVCVLFPGGTVGAEDWNMSGDVNLTATQNAYSDNWVGSGVGTASWIFNLNFSAEKQLTEKINNRNTAKLAFGQTYTQDSETDEWSEPQVSTDLIDLETILRFTLDSYVDPYVSGRLESHFYDSVSDPDKTKYFHPSTLTESAGIAKAHIDDERMSWLSRLGFSLKEHFFMEEMTTDGGLEFTSDFSGPVAGDNLTLTSKLSVYKAFFHSESDNLGDEWKAVDMNWENILAAQVSEYVTVNLYLQLLYDEEIIDEFRLKQTLSLGLTYKFI